MTAWRDPKPIPIDQRGLLHESGAVAPASECQCYVAVSKQSVGFLHLSFEGTYAASSMTVRSNC